MKKKIVLIGAGGFGREVFHIIDKKKYQVIGYIDNVKNIGHPLSADIIGNDNLIERLVSENISENVCISVGDLKIREKLFDLVSINGLFTPIIFHSSAIISRNVEIGKGSIIYPGAILMDGVKIGKGVLINSNVTIGHDSIVGNYCNINPGANIAGKVKIGKNTVIGIGSNVREEIVVGSNVIVGGGSMVTKNIISNSINYGVPSKLIRHII